MAEIRIENVEALGKPVGPYSHMARVKGAAETLYIAGMISPGDTFDAQCSGAFRQIETALKSAGGGWKNVVQFTTFLVHSQDIAKQVPAQHAPHHRPARAGAVPDRNPDHRRALARRSCIRRSSRVSLPSALPIQNRFSVQKRQTR